MRAAALLSAAACAAAAPQCVSRAGHDVSGGVVAVVENQTDGECCARCEADARCRGAVVHREVCYLKDASDPYPHAERTALLPAAQCRATVGMDVAGGVVAPPMLNQSAEGCCAHCAANRYCRGAVLHDGVCYMKDQDALYKHSGRTALSLGKAELWGAVREAVDAFAAVPDAVVVVGDRSGRLFLHEKGAWTLGTEAPIASATKWVSAVAILGAVRDGLLGLDDFAWQYLPYWTRDAADSRSHVTLRSTLAFNGGFSGSTSCLLLDFDACVRRQYDTLEHTHTPGERFTYNSHDLHFAGGMAAAAANMTMEELVARYVLHPAGMERTSWADPANPGLSGSLTSTPADYERFLHGYFTHQLIPAHLRAEAEKDQYPTADFTNEVSGRLGHYGFGNWFECFDLGAGTQWRPECSEADVHQSYGAHGWWPSTDRRLDYYFMIAMRVPYSDRPHPAQLLRLEVKPLIDRAVEAGRRVKRG